MSKNDHGNQGFYGQTMDYTVDMVFCIDATGSMEDSSNSQDRIINMVKHNAVNFYSDFANIMQEKNKKVRQLRVRIVAFRDFLVDGENAMTMTDFFLLPQQTEAFTRAINMIHAAGGGDDPEDGLEALAHAIKSKWTTEGAKKRQIIVVWTDDDAHNLGYGASSEYYPEGMPENLGELSDWWDDPALLQQDAKRLLLFAPNMGRWEYISANWELTWHIPSVVGNGLSEKRYSEILQLIANSV